MKAKDIAYIALCTAIIVVCSWITVPIPSMQFTLQVFAVAFAAYFLGLKRSLIAVAAFLALGLIGVPVFSNFNSGIGAFTGPTGGFLVGFLAFAAIISLFDLIGKGRLSFMIVGGFVGHLITYIIAGVWFVFVTAGGKGFFEAYLGYIVLMLPYYLIDLVKIAAAIALAKFLKKVMKN